MYNKYKKQNILHLQKQLSVQSLSVQKRDARIEFRLPMELKHLLENISITKSKSISELTILLWLDYLSKTKAIDGNIINKANIELCEDVEDFLKRA